MHLNSNREPQDPAQAVLCRIHCERCYQGDPDVEHYFAADGTEIPVFDFSVA